MGKLNNKGFTLAELMVVTAIIGILSAVGIQQFQQFQAKARQAEAKSHLGGIYSSMAAFNAEWGQYYGDFRDIGFSVSGDVYYDIGFRRRGARSPIDPLYNGFSGVNARAVEFSAELHTGSNIFFRDLAGVQCSVRRDAHPRATWATNSYIVEACGNIDSDNSTDHWMIDQSKAIRNTNANGRSRNDLNI